MVARMRILIGCDGSDCAEAAIYDFRRAGLPADVEAVVLTAAEVTPHLPAVCYEPVDPAVLAQEPPIVYNASVLAQAAIAEAKTTASQGADRVRAGLLRLPGAGPQGGKMAPRPHRRRLARPLRGGTGAARKRVAKRP